MAAAVQQEDGSDDLEIYTEIDQISSAMGEGTPLDRTIDKIGMGGYQYTLLALCGLGWAADNMWLQAVAIALPRVQVSFSVPSTSIGYLSATTFLGMMVGALLWGTLSDILGRVLVFKFTLSFTAFFGFLAVYVDTFPALCFANFLLGTAVGGSMPTDGTFALETLPKRKRHLLTSLSIFFSLGSVIAAVSALFVIPGNSCQNTHVPSAPPCDIHKDNNGWKYLFFLLSVITVVMCLARIFFMNLHESPRFLVHNGRKDEAASVLSKIAKFNGNEFHVILADVDDDHEEAGADVAPIRRSTSQYERVADGEEGRGPLRSPSRSRTVPQSNSASLRSTSLLMLIRRWIGVPIKAWYMRISGLLSGEWRNRTLLIWGIWMNMALAYTIFNVFLPTLLEYRSKPVPENHGSRRAEVQSSLTSPLWEIVIFTLGGCPGSLLGAYLVDGAPRWNLSKSIVLALVTLVTSASCLAFVLVSGYFPVILTTVAMSLSSTTMWSILYGMTPELFVTEVRGTASGTASALSRVGGIIAPILGGFLVDINPSLVILASVFGFCICAALLFLLHWSVTTPSRVENEY
ncbi:hypothetical protein FRB91_000445 [Serendipita sp. 411]|nr:hypothetical protein FRC15_000886 [Serendipita sp. 397]KAG8856672.1 hypothetical protein FRB91_000445 [Serendipita sp. 411]